MTVFISFASVLECLCSDHNIVLYLCSCWQKKSLCKNEFDVCRIRCQVFILIPVCYLILIWSSRPQAVVYHFEYFCFLWNIQFVCEGGAGWALPWLWREGFYVRSLHCMCFERDRCGLDIWYCAVSSPPEQGKWERKRVRDHDDRGEVHWCCFLMKKRRHILERGVKLTF